MKTLSEAWKVSDFAAKIRKTAEKTVQEPLASLVIFESIKKATTSTIEIFFQLFRFVIMTVCFQFEEKELK